jgi:DNA topoisomerase-1
MSVAQKLYEAGHITYMRTDSTNLSDFAIGASASEIKSRYGDKYSNSKQYNTKSKGAQEAHEAIRPTVFNVTEVDADYDGQRLYDLIWKRTIASQMANAETEKTNVEIEVSTNKEIFMASGEVIVFDGFLKVYTEGTDDEEDEDSSGLLPPLKVGQDLKLEDMTAMERFSRPAPRYTEASLVKKMEELGIGRPSTYAPTISTIQNRGYVTKGAREGKERKLRKLILQKDKVQVSEVSENYGAEKAKLFPSDIGFMVTDFLEENFKDIMTYSFTAKVESEFDDIATGAIKWSKMIDTFYQPFHKSIEHTAENSQRATKERVLGEHPESKEVVLARIGRYGPMVQIGQQVEEGPKPRYAKMKVDQSIETITLEEALDLFKLPRKLGLFEEHEVSASIGRFGPYVVHNKLFVSIPKDKDPYTITLEDSIDLIKKKREGDANKFIKTFEKEKIEILNGRYGPYIKFGKGNYKIPKDKVPADLTLEECQELIKEQDAKPKSKKAAPRRAAKK